MSIDYSVIKSLPTIHETTTKLINEHPEMLASDCIFVYFATEYITPLQTRYGNYYNATCPLVISHWRKGWQPITVYKGFNSSAPEFLVKDDKQTHHIDPKHKFYLLKIRLPAFKPPNSDKYVYRHEFVPITDKTLAIKLQAIIDAGPTDPREIQELERLRKLLQD